MTHLETKKQIKIAFASIIVVAGAMGTTFSAQAHPDHDENSDSKTRVEQSYDYQDFDKISVVGVFNMDVEVGGSNFSIKTSGEERYMSHLNVYVDDGTLYLDNDEDEKKRSWRGKKNKGIDITITLPSLNGLEVTGIGNGEIYGIDSNEFEVEFAGLGAMELSGRCGKLDVDYAGMGDMDARGLECEDVTIDMSGMGSASVYASESVDADMSGMGSIDVYGKPKKVKKDKGFMSSVDIH
ncbi:head GIN domain-containing protein [Litorimonas haliclonae]|uniref:head GIN domain-containing protein n=1 Tax=Litorimonas haliclonae TaxID=2081977 RepID=UPI0039F01FA6